MRFFLNLVSTLFVLFFFCLSANGQTLITSETFDEANLSTSGFMTGGEPWDANIFNNCDDAGNPNGTGWYWGVFNGEFRINDVEGFNCCDCGGGGGTGICGDNQNIISMGPIGITGFAGITIAVLASDNGDDMECVDNGDQPCPDQPLEICSGGNDQLIFEYSIDGSPYIVFEYLCGNNYCFGGPLACGLTGNNLMIRIKGGTQANSEIYSIQQVDVYGYDQAITNIDASPNASGCEGQSITLTENGGNAISWDWSGPAGNFSGNPYILNNITPADEGTYTLTITDSNGCTATDEVEITVNNGPTADISGGGVLCIGECLDVPFNIMNGTAPYSLDLDFSITIPPFPPTTVNLPLVGIPVDGKLTLCLDEPGSIPVFDAANNVIHIPEAGAGFDGTITLNSITDANNCTSNVASVFDISLLESPETFPATLEACDDGTGTADFDLNDPAFQNTINGGTGNPITFYSDIDLTMMITSPYNSGSTTIYAESTDGVCSSDAQITLTVVPGPDAGNDGTLNVCNDSSIDLTTGLGGSPDSGGSWSEITSSGVNLSNPNNVDFTGVTPGMYDFVYTVAGVSPCGPDMATVTVTVDEAADAGTNGNLNFCEGETALQDLNGALGGTPNAGGNWVDVDGAGVILTNPSAVDFSTTSPGDYNFSYTVMGMGACGDAVAFVLVSIDAAPDAGSMGMIDICEGDTNLQDLFNALGGSPQTGGIWNETTSSGADISNPNSVDFSNTADGVYNFTYTIAATATCPASVSSVTVTIELGPDAGMDGALNFCEGETNLQDLEAVLGPGAQTGGMWIDVDGSGVDLSFPNMVDFSNTGVGSYDFTYTVSASGCTDDVATVTVVITNAPNAGLDNQIPFCEGESSLQDFFALLNGTPDLGGTWNDDDASGVNLSNPNAVDISSLTAGMYDFTYLIPASGTCPLASATITIDIEMAPFAGMDGLIEICEGETTLQNLEDPLGGSQQTGGIWTDNNSAGVNLSDPTQIDFSSITAGTYNFTYTVAGSGNCPMDDAVITVDINPELNPGLDNALNLCEGSTNLLNFYNELGGMPDVNGVWTDDDASGVDLSDATMVDISNLDFGSYDFTYTVGPTSICPAKSSILTINLNEAPDAGIDGGLILCEGETNLQDLFGTLLGTPNTGGSWVDVDGSGVNLSNVNAVDFSNVAIGVYNFSYTVMGVPPCGNATSMVSVSITDAPSAGVDGILDLCEGDMTLQDLSNGLMGIPDIGGTWTDDDATGLDISNPSAVDFSTLLPGNYNFTYSIAASGSCPMVSATVTVNVVTSPNAGTDGSFILCQGETNLQDLFAGLIGTPDAGGSWVDENGSGANISNPSAVDFSGVGVGVYDFSYTIIGAMPCPDDASIVTVTITDAPDAGMNGTIDLCEGETTPQDLSTGLIGSPDGGGTWTDDDATGLDISNPSAVDFSTLSPGDYDFTYTIAASGSCPMVDATVTVSIETAPDAGIDGSFILCQGETNLQDLFAGLIGTPDAGGSWVDENGSGANISNPSAVDFSGVGVGVYDFSYTIIGAMPCPDDASNVTVTITDAPDAGMNGTIDLCEGETTPQDLSTGLIGSPDGGGTWTDDDATGLDISNPTAVDFSTLSPGDYDFTYTIAASGSCPMVDATVTVSIETAPDAGTMGALTLCEGETNLQNLFDALNGTPDLGGMWTDDDASGVNLSNPSAVDFSTLAMGDYDFSYGVLGMGVCGNASSFVTVSIVDAPSAGANGSIDICEGETVLQDLFAGLNGSPDGGGSWTDLDASGVNLAIPSAVDFSGVAPGSYDFNYEIAASGSCPMVSAMVTMNIETAPNAGMNGTLTLCEGETTFQDLDAVLGASNDLGGTWLDLNGAGVNLSNPFSVDFSTVPTGNFDFSYTVTGINGCNDAVAIISVAIVNAPTAGTDGSINLCEGDNTFQDLLGALNGMPDLGGVWSDDNATGIDISNPNMVDFSSLFAGDYNFTYTIAASGSCPQVSAIVTVSLDLAPNAGVNGGINVCAGDPTLQDLFAALGGTPDVGGSWSDDNGSGVNLSNPSAVDVSGLPVNVYNFTYTVSASGLCPADAATVQLTVTSSPDAGQDGLLELCEGDTNSQNLFAALNGAPQSGGTWIDVNGTGVDLTDPTNVDFAAIPFGDFDFTYSIPASGLCPQVEATVNVVINDTNSAGMDGTVEFCAGETTTQNLFSILIGTPDLGGVWTDDSGTGVDLTDPTSVDFSSVPSGIYLFTYSFPPSGICPASSAIVAITIVAAPNAGNDANLFVCEDDPSLVDLQSALGMNAQSGGVWIDVNATGVDLSNPTMVDVSTLPPGMYTYTYEIAANASCLADDADVLITIEALPNAGQSGGVLTICLGATELADFHEVLIGDETLGGNWSDDLMSGIDLTDPFNVDLSDLDLGVYDFSYSLSGIACGLVITPILVVVQEGPNAGISNTIEICSNGVNVIDVLAELANPDAGGFLVDINACGLDLSNPNAVEFSAASGTCPVQYVIPAQDFCNQETSTLTVEIEEALSAGEDNMSTVCQGSSIDLTSLVLNGDVGGTFTDVDMSGALTGSVFNSTGLTGMYDFIYTQPGSAICASDEAVITIEIANSVSAGEDVVYEVCEGEIVNLYNLLIMGDVGGLFEETTSPETLFDDHYINTTDMGGMVVTLAYTIGDGVTCEVDMSWFNVTVLDQPEVVAILSATTVCQEDCVEISIDINDTALNATVLMSLTNTQGFSDNTNISLTGTNHIVTICNAGMMPMLQEDMIELGSLETEWTLTLNNIQDDNCAVDTEYIFNLNSLLESSSILNNDFCPGESVIVNNVLYDEMNPSGTEVMTSMNGCDSIVDINLNYFPAPTGDENVTFCFGQVLMVGTEIFDENNPSGTVVLPNASANGCDSTVIVDLDYQAFAGNDVIETICIESSIMVNNVIYDFANPSGMETIVGGSAVGCDSIINVDLSFYTIEDGLFETTLCTGESIVIGGEMFDEDNPMGSVMLQGASEMGCDSVVNVLLDFDAFVIENVDPTICPDEFVVVNNVVYDINTPNGMETIANGSTGGCDSVIMIDLNFHPEIPMMYVDDLCAGQTLIIGSDVYDESNPSGTSVLPNASSAGCDSIVNVNLNFSSSVNGLFNPILCADDFVIVEDVLYDINNPTGQETIVGGSVAGCDSIITIDLDFYDPALGVYQDILCEDESVTIEGTVIDINNQLDELLIPAGSVNGCDTIIELQIDFMMNDASLLEEVLCEDGELIVGTTVFNESNPSGQVMLINQNGCDSLVSVVLSFETPSVQSSYSVTANQGEFQIEINPDFTPTSIVWTPETGLSCTNCLNPIATLAESLSYTITLEYGDNCLIQEFIYIEAEEVFDYYVPNAFSPNKNGINDYFYVQSDDLNTRMKELYIFDRWGEKIFSTFDHPINEPTVGWDGSFKGELLNPGVYVYLIILEKEGGEELILKGDVSIVR